MNRLRKLSLNLDGEICVECLLVATFMGVMVYSISQLG